MAEFPGTPAWVRYVFAGVMVLLAIGFVVTVVAGLDHGPGMHR